VREAKALLRRVVEAADASARWSVPEDAEI